MRSDTVGERRNGIRTDFRTGSQFHFQFQWRDARPCLMVRRYGPARGIYDWLAADGRPPQPRDFARSAVPAEYPAASQKVFGRRIAFGSNPVDLCKRHGDDSHLEFAQDTSIRKLQVIVTRDVKLLIITRETADNDAGGGRRRATAEVVWPPGCLGGGLGRALKAGGPTKCGEVARPSRRAGD